MSQETMEVLEQELDIHQQRVADALRIAAGESGVYASNAMVKAIVIDLRLVEREREDTRADVALRDGLITALEDDKRALCEKSCEQAQEIARLLVTLKRLEATDTENKQRLAYAQRELEEVNRDAAAVIDKATALFTRTNALRLDHSEPARPYSVSRAEAVV